MRIGVIGCGRQGQKRIADLLALGVSDILIHDADWERQLNAGITPDIRAYRSVTLLLDQRPDAVIICTPPGIHLDHLWDAYNHGVRAMFVEKPLALRVPDCDYSDCVTAVGANWRWNPGPSAVKSWLKAGVIGEPRKAEFHAGYYLPDVRPDWKTCYVKDTGACLDIGWHMVDLALDWFGPATLDESHLWACRDIGWPDTDAQAALYLKHDSGVESQVSVDLFQAQPDHYATVDGLIGKAGYSLRHRTASWRSIAEPGGESVDLEADDRRMFKAELAHFLDRAKSGRQTVNPISRARDTLAILLEAKARWRELSG